MADQRNTSQNVDSRQGNPTETTAKAVKSEGDLQYLEELEIADHNPTSTNATKKGHGQPSAHLAIDLEQVDGPGKVKDATRKRSFSDVCLSDAHTISGGRLAASGDSKSLRINTDFAPTSPEREHYMTMPGRSGPSAAFHQNDRSSSAAVIDTVYRESESLSHPSAHYDGRWVGAFDDFDEEEMNAIALILYHRKLRPRGTIGHGWAVPYIPGKQRLEASCHIFGDDGETFVAQSWLAGALCTPISRWRLGQRVSFDTIDSCPGQLRFTIFVKLLDDNVDDGAGADAEV